VTVSLPMYDLPACAAHTDRLRRALAATLGASTAQDRDAPTLWAEPGLLLSQTCGWPLLTSAADRLMPVATLLYDARGSERRAGCATYRSLLIVRADGPVTRPEDAVGGTAAINEWGSWSGRVILQHAFRTLARGDEPVFGEVFVSGAHVRSVNAVRAGRADIAAIDAVTYRLLERHQPSMIEGIQVLGETEWAPALPLVTRKGATENEIGRLRDGIATVMADPDLAETRAALGILDWVSTDLAA